MIDPTKTAYNLTIEAFKRSPYTVIYDPADLSAYLIIMEGKSLYATRIEDSQSPEAVARSLRRHDGSVAVTSVDTILDVLKRGVVAADSEKLSFFITVPSAHEGKNLPAGFAISDSFSTFDNDNRVSRQGGTVMFSILDATTDDVNHSRLSDSTKSLIAFK